MSLADARRKVAQKLADDPNALADALTATDAKRIPASESGLFDLKSTPAELLVDQLIELGSESEEKFFDDIIDEARTSFESQGMPKSLIDSIVTGMCDEILPYSKTCTREEFANNFTENELKAMLAFYKANPWFMEKSRVTTHKVQKKVLAKLQEVIEHRIDTDPSLDKAVDEAIANETKGDGKLFAQLNQVLDMDVDELTNGEDKDKAFSDLLEKHPPRNT